MICPHCNKETTRTRELTESEKNAQRSAEAVAYIRAARETIPGVSSGLFEIKNQLARVDWSNQKTRRYAQKLLEELEPLRHPLEKAIHTAKNMASAEPSCPPDSVKSWERKVESTGIQIFRPF